MKFDSVYPTMETSRQVHALCEVTGMSTKEVHARAIEALYRQMVLQKPINEKVSWDLDETAQPEEPLSPAAQRYRSLTGLTRKHQP